MLHAQNASAKRMFCPCVRIQSTKMMLIDFCRVRVRMRVRVRLVVRASGAATRLSIAGRRIRESFSQL